MQNECTAFKLGIILLTQNKQMNKIICKLCVRVCNSRDTVPPALITKLAMSKGQK